MYIVHLWAYNSELSFDAVTINALYLKKLVMRVWEVGFWYMFLFTFVNILVQAFIIYIFVGCETTNTELLHQFLYLENQLHIGRAGRCGAG